jgi:hypothetical protein
MNTITLIRNRAINSARRILVDSKNSSIFGSSLSHHALPVPNHFLQPRFNLYHSKNNHPFRKLGFQQELGSAHKIFNSPSSNYATSSCFSLNSAKRGARVGFKIHNFSTSVETRVNDNNFEKIYIQSGLNVKQLVVESVHKDEESVVREEESVAEKQAWKLLKDAIVTYCGNPVGTVAANDPGDKLPLNYDQVFIRDFIPSALAFLLKGDSEIVKYFLLHTLQLQVKYSTLKSHLIVQFNYCFIGVYLDGLIRAYLLV